jgi:membrane associated rhomboid family serine protease
MILFLLIVLGLAFHVMSPEQRSRLARAVLAAARHVKGEATRRRPDSFKDALRERTRWAIVTPALVALNVTIFVFMLAGAGAVGDPATLVAWGGNFGPRTTNGEWWRLVTAVFVHSGMLHLLVSVAGLVQAGLVLERLVGRLAFAAVYVVAGVFANLVGLSTHPVSVSVGASGAIFGIYGLLLAASIWGLLHRSTMTLPLKTVKRLSPAAGLFILYCLLNHFNGATDRPQGGADLAGFVAGLVFGLVLTRTVSDRKAPARWVAAAMAPAVAIAVAVAVPLRGIADVRPEIERVVAVEDRTSSAYQVAVDRFREGRMTAEALARLIDRTIMPELQAADARLKALDKVPPEHRPLVADAEEYVRLRSESWRLRSEGLRKTTGLARREAGRIERASAETSRSRAEAQHQAGMLTLGKAEGTERASLEALQRIRPAANQK